MLASPNYLLGFPSRQKDTGKPADEDSGNDKPEDSRVDLEVAREMVLAMGNGTQVRVSFVDGFSWTITP